jgi:hypothetical protein
MAVWDDVEAILNDPVKTQEVKRQEIYTLKCDAINAALRSPTVLNKPVTFDNVTYTVRAASVAIERGVPTLRVVVSAFHAVTGALLLSSDDVHVIINPPILTKGNAKDLAQVGLEILRNLLPRQGLV